MLSEFLIQTQRIQVNVVYSYRKSVSMQVKANQIFIKAPYGISDAKLKEFMNLKQSWIVKQLERKPKEYIHLDEGWMLVFGVRVSVNRKDIDAVIHENYPTLVAMIETWCKEYADQLGVNIQRIQIKVMKRSWGRCHSTGNLVFSSRLLHMHPNFIQAVCVHEVVHLKHMNHSAEFKKTCTAVCPSYKEWIALGK